MRAWTDYPFTWLGDTAHKVAPVREIRVLEYDGNKYCRVRVVTDEPIVLAGRGLNYFDEIKSGYVYQRAGRQGEVPCVTIRRLDRLALNRENDLRRDQIIAHLAKTPGQQCTQIARALALEACDIASDLRALKQSGVLISTGSKPRQWRVM
jgi:hypothetical protein